MTTRSAATAALAHARELAARGAGLTDAMRRERAALLRAIDAEIHSLDVRANALRPAAQGGDVDAGSKLIALTESKGDLINARAALGAQES